MRCPYDWRIEGVLPWSTAKCWGWYGLSIRYMLFVASLPNMRLSMRMKMKHDKSWYFSVKFHRSKTPCVFSRLYLVHPYKHLFVRECRVYFWQQLWVITISSASVHSARIEKIQRCFVCRGWIEGKQEAKWVTLTIGLGILQCIDIHPRGGCKLLKQLFQGICTFHIFLEMSRENIYFLHVPKFLSFVDSVKSHFDGLKPPDAWNHLNHSCTRFNRTAFFLTVLWSLLHPSKIL